MKKEKIIAYYPYSCNTNAYHGLIQEMLSERFFVIDYYDVKLSLIHISEPTRRSV